MTYEQYWYGDPLMVRAYYNAEKQRQKTRNEYAWLQGQYIFEAINATVGNMMRDKGSAQAKYPDKPYEFEPDKQMESDAEKEKREEQETVYAEAYMMNMVMAGKNWKK